MKSLSLVVMAAAVLVSGNAFADRHPHGHRPVHHRPVYHPHYPHHHHDRVDVSCANEDMVNGIDAAQTAMTELSAMPEFKDAVAFKAEVSSLIASKGSNQEKMATYLSYLNIDANDIDAIYAFVGAREVEQKYVDALAGNLQLTAKQAEMLAGKLQASLLAAQNR